MLKWKLNIPSTQLIQTSELIKIEKEKEALNNEMIDCKARFLKFEEREKSWEIDARIWDEKQNDFETRQKELEKELKELKEMDKGQKVKVISSSVQSGTYSLSQAMSQVILKEL